MSCDCRASIVALVAFALSGCVRSSGITPPEPETNVAVVDGEDVAVNAVNIYRGEEDEYGPGRRVFITALIGELGVSLQIGDFSAGVQEIFPFGIPDVTAQSGDNSDVQHVAVRGSLEVLEGSGEAGSAIELAVTQLELQETCSGATTTIQSASIRGEVVINEELLAGAEFDQGAVGYLAGNISHPDDGDIAFIGAAETRSQVLGNGTEILRADAFDACVGRNRVFTMLLYPEDVANDQIDLIGDNQSLVFFRETDGATTALVEDSLAIDGLVELDDLIVFADDAIVRGRMRDLVLLPVVDNDVIEDGSITNVSFVEFRTLMGTP